MMNKKSLLIVVAAVLGSLPIAFYSQVFYINVIVAMMSSIMIVMGSLYSYKNMILKRIEDVDVNDNKDIIDMMDDPYDLYEEEREQEVKDLKTIIKEEKARQKTNVIKNTTQNGSAWVSIYRIIPYAMLILGFIALENNHALQVLPYLVGLGMGIPIGYLISKNVFISR